MKLKKFRVLVFLLLSTVLLVCLSQCGSSSGKKQILDVPIDMPEVCQGIDFNLNVEMREMCGVKSRSYRAYKNVPQYRMLLRPKGGKIVRKGDQYQLRLPKMIPIDLPPAMLGRITFSEDARRTYVKSKWDYHEFFPDGSNDRIKIMRIAIPLNDGNNKEVCYTILSNPTKVRKVQEGFANQLEVLDCSAFDRLTKDQE
ncbi:MAG: hypothetical protein HQK83_03630 [Fibrobacteria bacterium]|nr:hypothetical protein [Fibrobacteria bacterium]